MEGVKEGVYSLKAIAYEETELKQKRAHVKLVKEQIIAFFFFSFYYVTFIKESIKYLP